MIYPNVLAGLHSLEELGIDVNPTDGKWNQIVESIVAEVAALTELTALCFYFPTVNSFETFIRTTLVLACATFPADTTPTPLPSPFKCLEAFKPSDYDLKVAMKKGVGFLGSFVIIFIPIKVLEEVTAFCSTNGGGLSGGIVTLMEDTSFETIVNPNSPVAASQILS
ncbi:hypothetical protein Pint_26106 [Pistacia integerrima]|uniref:Uncharacterized protein n=1 Tax=Pistacia integerrima TaxID=434235 RepID=A0ACC0YDY7_9ROSI|nr:hypothetical protein Pint_26106 [Pistacia integerrima]